MRTWLLGLLIVAGKGLCAQPKAASFYEIDSHMQSADAPTPDSLARIISSQYSTDLEKVRAVYSWITSHITYNTAIYRPGRTSIKYLFDPMDTAAVWPSGDEMAARRVMLRREAVCDGYSRLFKVLCDYTGVESALVFGFARGGFGDRRFRTNHTWNAVRIDSVWHLVDVTWAAGHLNWRDDYIASRNDYYFLTPPEQFIRDHYPEDLRWTLLAQPPTFYDFKNTPFRTKNFIKYDITSFAPAEGTIHAATGDTLIFSFQLSDVARARKISPDPFVDTAMYSLWPLCTFLKPATAKGDVVHYRYIVQPSVEWINIVYNDDIVLRYRLNVRERQQETLAGK